MRNDIIDWDYIWSIHCPYYSGGLAKIPLEGGIILSLKPGAGFGDLSHPTTSLILEQLHAEVKGKTVLDIGSGSGVLSLAAALLGAKAVYAFEIDPPSITHMRENLLLNPSPCPVYINEIPDSFDLVLMNMISSEQEIAKSHYPFLKSKAYTLIASGLLNTERDSYLNTIPDSTPLKEWHKDGWIALKVLINKT